MRGGTLNLVIAVLVIIVLVIILLRLILRGPVREGRGPIMGPRPSGVRAHDDV